MKNYLYIILRSKFTLFYRFGEMIVPEVELLSIQSKIDDNETKEGLLDLLKKITLIEYPAEALILHITTTNSINNGCLKLNLSDLDAIYPFTEQAKLSISEMIDSRIVLFSPIFEQIWNSYESWRIRELHLKGANILGKLCKIEHPADYYLEKIGIDGLYKGLLSREKRYTLSTSDSYCSHLIAYDRYKPFPKETIGYFYDAGEMYAYSVGKSTFENSQLHKSLEGYSTGLKFNEILDNLRNEEATKAYIEKTLINDLKWYEIAPLYFKLKSDIRNVNGDLSNGNLIKDIEYIKNISR